MFEIDCGGKKFYVDVSSNVNEKSFVVDLTFRDDNGVVFNSFVKYDFEYDEKKDDTLIFVNFDDNYFGYKHLDCYFNEKYKYECDFSLDEEKDEDDLYYGVLFDDEDDDTIGV